MSLTAALILGGRSTRMGRDKWQLIHRGRLLWEHQLETLRGVRPSRLLLSARPDQAVPETGVRVVRDAYGEVGPLGGIVSCLRELELDGGGSRLLVLAIDVPHVPVNYLQDMCFDAGPGRGMVPKHAGRWEPLIAVYPVEALAIGRQCLAARQYSLQTFCDECAREGLIEAFSDPNMPNVIFTNINTPEEAREEGIV
jgi:molybdenum cofactor guanylyltransferase